MNRKYVYTKYTREKTVRNTSKVKIAGFLSTAVKYPCWTMSAKTSTCRNMAPPMQLNPNVWNSIWSRRSGFGAVFIAIVNVKSHYFNLYVVNPCT